MAVLAVAVWSPTPITARAERGVELIAEPNPVPPGGGPGTTSVRWSTGNGRPARLEAIVDGRSSVVTEGTSGVIAIDWLPPRPASQPTELRLYARDGTSIPLAALSISRDDDRWSLLRSAAALSGYFAILVLTISMIEQRTRARPATIERLGVIVLCGVAGLLATVMVYRPGVMSNDSVFQFQQASTGSFTAESFPPIMSFIWFYTHKLIPGPLGMMLLHNLVFWTGLGLIAWACTTRSLSAFICMAGIGFCPPVFALLGILWKDVGLGAALVLFAGLVMIGAQRRSRGLLATALVPLFYAVAVRLNAAPAVVPLAWWWWHVVASARGTVPRALTTLGMSGVITALLVVLGTVVDAAIVTRHEQRQNVAVQGSLLHDLAGISVRTGGLSLPRYLQRPEMSLPALRQWYDPSDGGNGFLYRYDFVFARTPEEWADLRDAWWQAVRRYPRAYLAHRIDVLTTLLEIRGMYEPFHRGIDPNDLGLTFPSRPLNDAVVHGLDRLTPLFFRGWFFFLMLIVTAGFSIRHHWDAGLALTLSALMYALPYTVITGGSDFRYIWWPVLAAMITLLMIAGRVEVLSAPRSPAARRL